MIKTSCQSAAKEELLVCETVACSFLWPLSCSCSENILSMSCCIRAKFRTQYFLVTFYRLSALSEIIEYFGEFLILAFEFPR